MDRCIQSMLLNHHSLLDLIAAEVVHGATDISGFGLLGHLAEMAKASRVAVEIDSQNIPQLPGVDALIEQGISSTLALANLHYAESLCLISNLEESVLLCDPQTSGAMLLSLSAESADAWVKKARELGFADCAVIGRVSAGEASISIS